MLKYIPRDAGVLDAGCGFGLPSAQASEYFNITACDINSRGTPALIELLMKLRNINFKWSEKDSFPFPDQSFDAIFLYAVIEHVPNKVAFLREC